MWKYVCFTQTITTGIQGIFPLIFRMIHCYLVQLIRISLTSDKEYRVWGIWRGKVTLVLEVFLDIFLRVSESEPGSGLEGEKTSDYLGRESHFHAEDRVRIWPSTAERLIFLYRIYSSNRPGRLLNFWTLRVGTYSGWALIKFSSFSASEVLINANNKTRRSNKARFL